MKKKLALVVISLDECFTQEGFSGGGHKVTKKLIAGLVDSGLFDIDIFCKKSTISSLKGINSITVLNKKTFNNDLKNALKNKKYDYVFSSDILLPFANLLIHSNSAKYKCKNGKNKFHQMLAEIYNYGKIKKQERIFKQNDKTIFTVSESLKQDYVQNYNLPADRVFACLPAIDKSEAYPIAKNPYFTIGSMAGGGLNKGGFLLLLALKKSKKVIQGKLKSRIIFPKIHKSGLYRFGVKAFGLQDIIELLPKQSNMEEFYKSVDCYVLPSLNEAFGLVVTEAAAVARPSIVSSTTGVCELIKDGENGFVFDRTQKPVTNLAKKIEDVINLYFNDFDKYQLIAQNAYQVAESLDWKRFTDTIIYNLKEEEHEPD